MKLSARARRVKVHHIKEQPTCGFIVYLRILGNPPPVDSGKYLPVDLLTTCGFGGFPTCGFWEIHTCGARTHPPVEDCSVQGYIVLQGAGIALYWGVQYSVKVVYCNALLCVVWF